MFSDTVYRIDLATVRASNISVASYHGLPAAFGTIMVGRDAIDTFNVSTLANHFPITAKTT